MPVDTSFYPIAQPAPTNALNTYGEYQGIANAIQQNRLLQQHVQQAQVATQQAQGQQKLAQIISKNSVNGTTDWLGVKSDAAKDPATAIIMDHVNSVADPQLAATNFGVTSQGAPRVATLQNVQNTLGGGNSQPKENSQSINNGQPAPENSQSSSPPTIQTDIAPIQKQNMQDQHQHWQDVQADADSARTQKAALSNVYDLSKSGAPTGQVLGSFYSYLAQHDLAPSGAQTDAEKLQLIKDHAAQIATAASPTTDAKLLASQLANVNETDLPKVLQQMIPYLQGVQDSKIARAQYYTNQDPTGTDSNKIQNSRGFWQQHADPRLWELQELQKSDAEAFKERLSSLSPHEKAELAQHSKALRSAKALGQ